MVRGEDAEGRPSYELTVELPEDFALDQPLSPFLLAALDLLDPESPDYALDVISLVEATLENPAKVLRAQERKARDAAMAEMKADGVEYEERLERLAEITYPKPLEELLGPRLRAVLPGRAVGPRLRAGAEERAARHGGDGERFQDLHRPLRHREVGGDAAALPVRRLPRARAHATARSRWTIGCATSSPGSASWCAPPTRRWWTRGRAPASCPKRGAPPQAADAVVADRHGMEVMVRNALFARVRLAALDRTRELGNLDEDWGLGERAVECGVGRLLRRAQRDPPRWRRAVRRLSDDRREPASRKRTSGTSVRYSWTRKTPATSA